MLSQSLAQHQGLNTMQTKFLLDEEQMPRYWYNLQADFPEIIDFMPQLATGTEPAMHNLSGRSGFVSLWLRYARLRQFIDRYLSGLRAIHDRPIVRLSSRREQMPLHMAKRIDGITVQRLTANAALLSALSGDLDAEPPLAPEQCNLDVPFHEPTMDNPDRKSVV